MSVVVGPVRLKWFGPDLCNLPHSYYYHIRTLSESKICQFFDYGRLPLSESGVRSKHMILGRNWKARKNMKVPTLRL